jgi:hypothetical protein
MRLRGFKRILLCASRALLLSPFGTHCICPDSVRGRYGAQRFTAATDRSAMPYDYAFRVKALAKWYKSASFERFRFCIVDSTKRRTG